MMAIVCNQVKRLTKYLQSWCSIKELDVAYCPVTQPPREASKYIKYTLAIESERNTCLSADEILRNFGGFENNMLQTFVNSIPDENEITCVDHSPYYAAEMLPNYLNVNENNLTIFSCNIQSILAKFSSLQILLEIFRGQNIRFDVICLQESWLKDEADVRLINLPGYKHGGLLTYVHEDLTACVYKRVNQSDVWEGLFVEICGEHIGKKHIIGNIYKPPTENNNNRNIQQFISEIELILCELNSLRADVSLIGDNNINLLQINERDSYSDLFDLLVGNSFYPKISLPTRLSTWSSTLIDNCFSKIAETKAETKAGIIYTRMSDHFPYFVSIKYRNYKNESTRRMTKVRINTNEAKQTCSINYYKGKSKGDLIGGQRLIQIRIIMLCIIILSKLKTNISSIVKSNSINTFIKEKNG